MTAPFDVDREEQQRRAVAHGRVSLLGAVVEVRVRVAPTVYAYERGRVVAEGWAGVVVELPEPYGRVARLASEVSRPPRPRATVAAGRDLMPGTNALAPFGRPRTRAEVERRRAGS